MTQRNVVKNPAANIFLVENIIYPAYVEQYNNGMPPATCTPTSLLTTNSSLVRFKTLCCFIRDMLFAPVTLLKGLRSLKLLV